MSQGLHRFKKAPSKKEAKAGGERSRPLRFALACLIITYSKKPLKEDVLLRDSH